MIARSRTLSNRCYARGRLDVVPALPIGRADLLPRRASGVRHAGGRAGAAAARPRRLDRAGPRSPRRPTAVAGAGSRGRRRRHVRRGRRLADLGRLHLPAREPAVVRAALSRARLPRGSVARRLGGTATRAARRVRARGGSRVGDRRRDGPAARGRRRRDRRRGSSRSTSCAAALPRSTPASSSSSRGWSSTGRRSAPGSGRPSSPGPACRREIRPAEWRPATSGSTSSRSLSPRGCSGRSGEADRALRLCPAEGELADRAERDDQLLRLTILGVRHQCDEAVTGLGRDRREPQQRAVMQLGLDLRLLELVLGRERCDSPVDPGDELVERAGHPRDPELRHRPDSTGGATRPAAAWRRRRRASSSVG